MTTIACLGWGSLIWNPESLPVKRPWETDGPLIQVEFVRQSGDGRMTLVLEGSARPVRSLWALLNVENLETAIEALGLRERIPNANHQTSIGRWLEGNTSPPLILGLPEWAKSKGIDAVIWTDLPPRFNGKNGQVPTIDEVTTYLKSLSGHQKEKAEEYIRRAPEQIKTVYRQRIESELGWFQEAG